MKILMGLQPKKSQAVRLELLLCSPFAGSAATKISSTQSAIAILQLSYWACYQKIQSSEVVKLQLLSCSLLAGPAATKISSSQIAVATLQLSCWTCRPKNLKQSDCENHARKMRTFFTRRLEPNVSHKVCSSVKHSTQTQLKS